MLNVIIIKADLFESYNNVKFKFAITGFSDEQMGTVLNLSDHLMLGKPFQIAMRSNFKIIYNIYFMEQETMQH